MDIFTTVLTRVVPVPIKPANLKVKALLKEAATGGLKEDPDHLENHDYFVSSMKRAQEKQEQPSRQQQSSDQQTLPQDIVEISKPAADDKSLEIIEPAKSKSDRKPKIKHLDIYI